MDPAAVVSKATLHAHTETSGVCWGGTVAVGMEAGSVDDEDGASAHPILPISSGISPFSSEPLFSNLSLSHPPPFHHHLLSQLSRLKNKRRAKPHLPPPPSVCRNTIPPVFLQTEGPVWLPSTPPFLRATWLQMNLTDQEKPQCPGEVRGQAEAPRPEQRKSLVRRAARAKPSLETPGLGCQTLQFF